jgi:non-specific serine/threonine protein kinase
MTLPVDPAAARPRPEVVLRALREARGLTQQGWSALLGYSVATVRRWESGTAVPNAETQQALVAACSAWGLFRTFSQGPLRGVTLTPDLLRDVLAEARLGTRHAAEDELPIQTKQAAAPGETFGQPTRPPAEHPHNLPVMLTSFVGREHELDEVKRLLRRARLVTLTGSGGAGKTRLAIKVAGELLEAYPHGVWLVELAPLVDPALVPQAVASAVHVREQPGRPVIASLVDHLRAWSALLVLDNCEHVVAACAELMDALLRSCPGLHVLATSREALNIEGETAWRVPSLASPEPGRTLPIEQMGQYPAVRLLVDRARGGQPDFVLTRQNAAAVAQLCWRLDGMPLALELAAARVKLLSVEEIAHRLDDRFGFLTAGSRSALPRQQTLRATVDWSYELLGDDERRMLRRLSVFSGSWTLEAAEAVVGSRSAEHDGDVTVVDLLARLVDKSLVVREPDEGEARFGFLETIRAYARIKLVASGEADEVRDRHLAWCVSLVERARPYLVGRTQSVWLGRLDREHDNVRAGLRWAFERGQLDASLRIGGAFWRFWWLRGSFREGRAWLNDMLERRGEHADPIAMARVLEGAGLAAFDSGELPLAEERFTEALALRRTAGEPAGIATALGWLSFVVMERGDDQRGVALADEGLAMAKQTADQHTIAAAVIRLGRHLTLLGEPSSILADLEQALQTVRRLDDVFLVCVGLSVLGDAQLQLGDLDAAARLYAECVRLRREHHMLGTNPSALFGWSDVLRLQHLLPEAHALCGEGLRLAHEYGVTRDVAVGLRALGSVAVDEGQAERGALLCGASEAIVEPLGMHLGHAEQARMASTLARAEERLGQRRCAEARAAGAALGVDEAVALALASPA